MKYLSEAVFILQLLTERVFPNYMKYLFSSVFA